MYQQLIKPQINSREACELVGIDHREFLRELLKMEERGQVMRQKRVEARRTVGTETAALFLGEEGFIIARMVAARFCDRKANRIALEFFHRLAALTEWQKSIGQVMGADFTKEAQ